MIHGHRLLDLHHFEDPLDAVATEDAQDVVFCRKKELRFTGIPLPAGPPSQLVVDTARLMTLGPKDEETSQADDLIMFLRPRLTVLCKELGVLFRVLFCVLFRLFLGVSLDTSNSSGVSKSSGIAAEQNVDASARHVRGNRDGSFAARLGDDLRFLLMILGVQHLVLDAKLLQLMAQPFGFLDGTRTHKDGLPLLVPVSYTHLRAHET